jgi:hypothetical protein
VEFCLLKIALQGASSCYIHVYMYYILAWVSASPVFLLSILAPLWWFQQVLKFCINSV